MQRGAAPNFDDRASLLTEKVYGRKKSCHALLSEQTDPHTLGHLGQVTRHKLTIDVRIDEEQLGACGCDDFAHLVKIVKYRALLNGY